VIHFVSSNWQSYPTVSISSSIQKPCILKQIKCKTCIQHCTCLSKPRTNNMRRLQSKALLHSSIPKLHYTKKSPHEFRTLSKPPNQIRGLHLKTEAKHSFCDSYSSILSADKRGTVEYHDLQHAPILNPVQRLLCSSSWWLKWCFWRWSWCLWRWRWCFKWNRSCSKAGLFIFIMACMDLPTTAKW
jgi:hypothetical protein